MLPVDYEGAELGDLLQRPVRPRFSGVVESDTDSMLEFKDEMSQAVLSPVGADGCVYTYVIMPMRV